MLKAHFLGTVALALSVGAVSAHGYYRGYAASPAFEYTGSFEASLVWHHSSSDQFLNSLIRADHLFCLIFSH